jgi:RNA polymerase sigma factor for flagellar operon FliA
MLTAPVQQKPLDALDDRSRFVAAPLIASTNDATAVAGCGTDALWLRYRSTKDKQLRDRLIVHYTPLVKRIAALKAVELRKTGRMPAGCDVDEFVSCGLLHLISAIDRYDPAGAAAPETFLWARVHGAICDYLRKLDWAPRGLRRLEREMQVVRLGFTTTNGRLPTTVELAGLLGCTHDQVLRHQQQIATSELASLNEVVIEDEHGRDPDDPADAVEHIDVLHSLDLRSDPVDAAVMADTKARFRVAFNALPRRQREVLALLYVEELTLADAGIVVGVSGSRISQIHKEIRSTLRLVLCDDAPMLAEAA